MLSEDNSVAIFDKSNILGYNFRIIKIKFVVVFSVPFKYSYRILY